MTPAKQLQLKLDSSSLHAMDPQLAFSFYFWDHGATVDPTENGRVRAGFGS
jgi:hypothetical protein